MWWFQLVAVTAIGLILVQKMASFTVYYFKIKTISEFSLLFTKHSGHFSFMYNCINPNSFLIGLNQNVFFVGSIFLSKPTYCWLLVMSPSRSDLSHSASWRIFSSAWLVSFSLKIEKFPKSSRNLRFENKLGTYCLI